MGKECCFIVRRLLRCKNEITNSKKQFLNNKTNSKYSNRFFHNLILLSFSFVSICVICGIVLYSQGFTLGYPCVSASHS